MTSASTYTATGSSDDTYTYFEDIDALIDMVNVYPQALQEALSETKQAEEDNLREAMLRHPDWMGLSEHAAVDYSGGQFSYRVSDQQELASALEYGDPTRKITATGLLRSMAKRREEDAKKELVDRLARKLRGE